MPISIVVGGQFGSEGKGKVALEIVRRTREPVTAVRVGGPNSGHTAFDKNGRKWALRQMPAACVDLNVDVVFPAGSYIDVDLLLDEIEALKFPRDRIHISEHANVVTEQHKIWEVDSTLAHAIGSTGSGVGAAVMAAAARDATNFPLSAIHASDTAALHPFICDTTLLMREQLSDERRIVIEGSQGFGLSLLDGGYWPKATARSTTAAAALAEAGLSPRDVDNVTLVLRSFPIRVAGNSGKLVGETTWENIARDGGISKDIREFTTVTRKERRVGQFDARQVSRAIAANRPDTIVINHLDYIGPVESISEPNSPVSAFVDGVEKSLNTPVHWLGFDPLGVVERSTVHS
ncbi:adenylosuccinate synthetase [Mesorhizobium sp. M0644]|uniref:adenylosuccinate synthetase n=1 Tax=Mesorhizobium sp. M0644 TaxID=2956979 RepID=UPI00333CA131